MSKNNWWRKIKMNKKVKEKILKKVNKWRKMIKKDEKREVKEKFRLKKKKT